MRAFLIKPLQIVSQGYGQYFQKLTCLHVGIISFIREERGSKAVSFGTAAATVMGDLGLSLKRREESSKEI